MTDELRKYFDNLQLPWSIMFYEVLDRQLDFLTLHET